MIKIIEGNILNAKEDIIAHQVNCQGVMGAGLAKQIKSKYYNSYLTYKNMCDEAEDKKELLGRIKQYRENDGKTICHIFSQLDYGRSKRQTDYEALHKGLKKLEIVARNTDKTIALPFGIGCGLAGGDWSIVYKIIEDVFKDYEVTLYKFN